MEKREFDRGPERPRRDRGRHERKREDLRREPHDHRGNRRHHIKKKMTTKLFTDKEVMIDYVNDHGEQGHHIDVFKIEEGLYKVVVVERKNKEDIEIDID